MNHPAPLPAALKPLQSEVVSLARRSGRDAAGNFWFEGVRQFVQAHDAGFEFQAVLFAPVLLKSHLAQMLIRRLKAKGIPCWKVTPEVYRKFSTAARACGIGAICRQRWTPLTHAPVNAQGCWLVAEDVRSPGNLGTILRTAEAIGAAGLICVGPMCDPYATSVIRASMGGVFRLTLCRTTFEQLAEWLDRHHVQLVGLSPDAGSLWTSLPGEARLGLVIGGERRGISDRLRALCSTFVKLPMTGFADSLNVSVAAGVVLYELVRRREMEAGGRMDESRPRAS